MLFQCSSASRKFLNRRAGNGRTAGGVEFQCSSASRKFLNLYRARAVYGAYRFQCSSASRKFLNQITPRLPHRIISRFSALQRAENSSIGWTFCVSSALCCVSVLFSDPKIPQFIIPGTRRFFVHVSVLFSEPKIPQSITPPPSGDDMSCFSALQRAENSSMRLRH